MGQYISFPKAERWFTTFGRFEFRLSVGDGVYGVPLPLLITLAVIALFAVLLAYWTPCMICADDKSGASHADLMIAVQAIARTSCLALQVSSNLLAGD
jgi:hypothetical protein